MVLGTCSSCGAKSPEGFRFCGYCGAPVRPSYPVPVPEPPGDERRSARRVVTILYADLVNYTSAASRADLEEVFLTIRKTLEELSQPIRRLGGHVDRYVGDAVMATFGVPEAHEDDPIRALLAAMEMQQVVARLREETRETLGWEAQLRVGINLGPVISGEIDTGSAMDSSVFGHAVNVAHRLQHSARPGTILVTESVYRRTRAQFSFLEPVRLQLRGIDQPVVAYELIGMRPDPEPLRGLSGMRTPLVGRSAEIDAVMTGLRAFTIDRSGTIILVTGPAGIGKTRLVQEVMAPLTEHCTVVRAECSASETASYSLLINVLESLFGILPGDSAAVRGQKVSRLLSPAESLTRDVAPLLRGLVGAEGGEERALGDPQQQQRRFYAAVRRLFAWAARRRPVLVVLDDLQWVDPSSWGVLLHVADLVYDAPVALVAIARSSAHDDLAGSFERSDLARPETLIDVALGPLSLQESERLLSLLLNSAALPSALEQSIVERGGGSPLIIEEMVRMLLDKEVIRETSTGWAVEGSWSEVIQQVPETVSGLVLSRYDRLTPNQKKILDAASVLGRFTLSQLAPLAGLPDSELRSELARLEQADFLRRSPGGAPVFHFRHVLMQEAIYQTLFRSERKRLHMEAASVLLRLTDDRAVDSAALIGHHLEQSRSPEAIPYLMRAADQAAARFANEEASAYFRRVELLLGRGIGTPSQAIDMKLGLAEVLMRMNRLDDARARLEEARELSASAAPGYRHGDVAYLLGRLHMLHGQQTSAQTAFETAAECLRVDPGQCLSFSPSDIERQIGWVLCHQGRLTEAKHRADRALELASAQDELEAVAGAHNLLARLHYWAGDHPASIESAQAALAIREQMGDVWGAASMQTNLALVFHRQGKWAQAESYLRQAIFVQQEIGDRQGVVLSTNNLGLVLLESGRFDEAMDWMNQAVGNLQRQEHPPAVVSQVYGNRGLLWLRMGQLEHAMADLERCRAAADRADNVDLRALSMAYLAEAHLHGHLRARALEILRESESLAAVNSVPEIVAEVARVRSLILKDGQNWMAALKANREAQALYRQIGNSYETARLQVDAADVELAWSESTDEVSLDRKTQARVLEALEILRRLGAQADIAKAEEVLVRASSHVPATRSPETRSGSRPVLAVSLILPVERMETESMEQQEALAVASQKLSEDLKRIGRAHGAIVTTTEAGLSYLFRDGDQGGAAQLALMAVKSARVARDTALHIYRQNRRQGDVCMPVRIGVVGGDWEGPLNDPHDATIFGTLSVIGQQAQAAAAAARDFQIVVSASVSEAVQSAYEMLTIETDRSDPLAESLFLLGQTRSETQLPQELPGPARELVGRQREVEQLLGWIGDLVDARRGGVCYLEAEAGMGKTRLLEDVLAHARASVTCLVGKCESFRSNISYWPLIDMLENGTYEESEISERLRRLLALHPTEEPEGMLLRNLSPAHLQQELVGYVREFLIKLAGTKPVLVVVEDIHWLDLSTLDLLDALMPITLQASVSFMLVARSEIPGPHRALVAKAERLCRDRYLRVGFSGLTGEESQSLVRGLLETDTLPKNLWDHLAPFSGHPLSLEEALRFLVERGLLWRSNGRWQMAESEGIAAPLVPQSFRDLLLGRLDSLDSETLHVFQAAAVLGETFDRTVLSRTIPGTILSSRLAELEERRWLLPSLEQENPLVYRFKHTLTRETIYATLLASKRQVLHQRAGEAIEELYPDADEYAELLAYHFGNTALREKSLHYMVRAAEKSAARHALAESLSYYQRASGILDVTGAHVGIRTKVLLGLADVHLALGEPTKAIDDLDRMLESDRFDLSPAVHAQVLYRLGEARRRTGEFAQALAQYQSAQAILAGTGETPKLPEVAADAADEILWTVNLGLAQTLFDMRRNQEARESAEGVLRAMDPLRYPKLTAEVLGLLGGIAYRRNDHQTAAEMVRRSLAIYQRAGNRSGAAAAYSNLGMLAVSAQDLTAAHDRFTLSLSIREALGDMQGVAVARNNLGQLERSRGNFAQAIEHLEIASDTAGQLELAQIQAQSLSNLGLVLTLAGRTEEGLTVLDDAESLCESYGFKNLLCEVWWERADCLAEAGHLDAAAVDGKAAVRLAEELRSHGLKSESLRALGRVYRWMNRSGQAVARSQMAWELRTDDSSPVTRARFAAELALALLTSGQVERARTLIREQVVGVRLFESQRTMAEVNKALAKLGLSATEAGSQDAGGT
jgi:predicted ATPase/class 3 adenylate cyclase